MMARSTTLQHKAGYIDARPPLFKIFLLRTAGPYIRVNRFSNRPFRVKRFQTNHHHSSVDVAHGLVLLFGIGTRPFHHGS